MYIHVGMYVVHLLDFVYVSQLNFIHTYIQYNLKF